MMNMWSWIVLLVLDLTAIVPVVLLPRLAPSMLLFGVYVPEEDRENPAVVAILRKYMYISLFMIIAGFAAGAAVYYAAENMPIAAFGMTLSLQLLGAIASMVLCRRSALKLKASRGWTAPADATRRVADLRFREKRSVLHNGWFLIPLLIVALCAGTAIVQWDNIPDPFASHFGMDGKSDKYSARTFSSVFTLNLIQLALIGLFMGINALFKKSKQQLDPNRPEASRDKQLQSRRVNSIFLFAMCLFIIAFFGYIQAEMLYTLTVRGVEIVAIVLPLAMVGGIVGFMIYLNKKGLDQPAGSMMLDDRHWRGGVFYYNADDSSLFVAKRYGVGWTLNFARPLSWVFMGVILLLPVAIVVLVVTTAG